MAPPAGRLTQAAGPRALSGALRVYFNKVQLGTSRRPLTLHYHAVIRPGFRAVAA